MNRRTLIASGLALSLSTVHARAQTSAEKATVDAAKAQGLVGEQGDGFLGLVTGAAPAEVKSAVAAINAGRVQAYRDIGAKTGVSATAAGEATAIQLVARLPAGAYYKPLGGAWTRK